MTIDHRSLSRRACASVITLSLIAGLTPATWAFADISLSSDNANAAKNANTESTTGNTSSNTNKDSNSQGSAGNTSGSSSKNSAATTNSGIADSSAVSENEDAADNEEPDDPYASTYGASNAEAGESNGEISSLTADTSDIAAVLQTSATWAAADTVILVPTNAGAEILCAASLAGALGCPVLFMTDGQLSEATYTEMAALGVTKAIIIANSSYDTKAVEALLTSPTTSVTPSVAASTEEAEEGLGEGADETMDTEIGTDDEAGDDSAIIFEPIATERIKGASSTDLALSIAQYGQAIGAWNLTSAIFANGADVACARATAATAYRLAQPVILTTADGKLPSLQTTLSKSNSSSASSPNETLLDRLENALIIAEDDHVPDSAIDSIKLLSNNASKHLRTQRLSGADANAVNYRAETWYASTQSLNWDTSVVVNINQASSATAGIMAARSGVAELATTGDSLSPSATIPSITGSNSIVISGEGSVLDASTLNALRACSAIYSVTTEDAGITLDEAANREVDNSMDTEGVAQKAKDDILEAMDPGRASRGTEYYYEFALLDEGYSGAVSADQINAFIDDIAGSYEASYGTTSLLRGTGQAFIDAAKEYGINEIYLLANAIHESACGCSQLAQGSESGAYNFFGIAAYDSNPDNGASFAASAGWDTPEAAVMGGGKWISENFIHSPYAQNTLYRMRFNVPLGSHQYASGLGWNTSIAKMMSNFYSFAGITLEHTGLNFKVETYSEL